MAASAVALYFSAGGGEIEVIHLDYKLSRSIGMKGRPSSVTQGA